MSLKNIALFGANGQIGNSILKALTNSKSQKFNILAITAPDSPQPSEASNNNVTIKEMDLLHTSRKEMAQELQGIDAVVSALNGPVLDAQIDIQDGAADAGVKRFIPSEYGMHHIYRKPNDPQGYIHPLWDAKNRLNERAILHPAIKDGRMSYTMIGCGDFYNQDREKVWCPWTQKDVDEYTLHVIGDPNAKADYTHIADFGHYVAACLSSPSVSENAHLNFPSDHISHSEIADLLQKHSGKKVNLDIMGEDKMHEVVADPESAPKHLQNKSSFPVDFWFLVKGMQGSGRFWRPRGMNHNHLFPEIKPTVCCSDTLLQNCTLLTGDGGLTDF
ncbi:NAD(P)-binding protein, partial [Aureobasidium melanogenum]